MMGFGFLFMLLALAVPVIMVVLLGLWLFNNGTQKSAASIFAPAHTTATRSSEHTCSHCGTQLQTNWSHCPKCGAAIE